MNTVLAPIDFSDATTPVVTQAADLCRALGGRLVLLNVTAPPFIASDDPAAANIIVQLASYATKAAAKQLAHVQRTLQSEGITAVTRHCSNSVVVGILDEAKELRAGYIVIGSHGHGAFHDLVAGSTTSGVLKRANCPVMVVPVRGKESSKTRKT